MLIPTEPGDMESLIELADRTGVFYPHEIETLREVLDDYFRESRDDYGHLCFTARIDDRIAGFVYVAPIEMTDCTWEMWWIAVDRTIQNQGIGRKILEACESILAQAGCRVLLIETSSLPHYQPTRNFYLKYGYTEVANIPDYYRDGDDKRIFWKKLARNPTSV